MPCPESGSGKHDAGDADRRARDCPCSSGDLGAMTPSYHANMVNAQLLLDFSGSSAPVASCGTRAGMLTRN